MPLSEWEDSGIQAVIPGANSDDEEEEVQLDWYMSEEEIKSDDESEIDIENPTLMYETVKDIRDKITMESLNDPTMQRNPMH